QIILTANQPRSGTHHFSARASVQTSDSVDAVEGRFVPKADIAVLLSHRSRSTWVEYLQLSINFRCLTLINCATL
ncbi:hypothetical protein E4W60_14005, partial [Klebsiella pneumoniae]|nr:hypothetical protein [Klebsiella pneumoniae]MBA0096169.1 hypothetical protein [Klebsiella pneumoniae]